MLHGGSHTYDTAGDLRYFTDLSGQEWEYRYDDDHNLNAIIDPRGINVLNLSYDAQGRLIGTSDALGYDTSVVHDTANVRELVTDPMGHTRIYEYDTDGNVVTEYFRPHNGTEELVRNMTYDAKGNQLTESDAEGHVVHYEYDARGNKSRQYETVSYGDNQSAILTTLYEYDDAGRLVKSTQPDGRYTQTIYNSIGKAWKTRDLDGRWTEYTYSDRGEQVGVLYWDNTTEATAYTETGKQDTHTDREGIVTKYEYDAKGRQSKVYRFYGTADEAMTETVYDSTGRVVGRYDALRNYTASLYDMSGNRTREIDALGNSRVYTYDARGNQITAKLCDAANQCSNRTRSAYDSRGRNTATYHVAADGAETLLETVIYSNAGRVLAKTDAKGNLTQYRYDANGRLVKVIDALNNETDYTYDERGNKLTQTDALDRVTRWRYDALGRMTTHILPGNQTETYGYDASGVIAWKRDFNGNLITYTADERHRITAELYADGTSQTYTYLNPSGRRQTSTGIDGVTYTYGYHPVTGRVTSITGPNGPMQYTYDPNGNKTSVTGTDTMTYQYDALGRETLTTKLDSTTTARTYTIFGKPATVTDFNGMTASFFYDDLGRLIRKEVRDADGVLTDSFDYELDLNGNRTKETQLSGKVIEYGYDALNRLTSETVTMPDGTTYETTYDLAPTGNRTALYTLAGSIEYIYDPNDRLVTETHKDLGGNTLKLIDYTYNDNGNLISKGDGTTTILYAYNAKNRLVGMIDGATTATYRYDADGIRVSKTVNGQITNYLVDKNRAYPQVVADLDAAKQPTAVYRYDDDLLAMERGGNTYSYLTDGHGSTKALYDQNGTMTDSYEYDAFGNITEQSGTTPNSHLYTGEQFDPELGTYYLRARHYDPSVGRFTQRDSWAGSQGNPITMNKYLYADGNPVMGRDPSGRMTVLELMKVTAIIGVLSMTAISCSSEKNDIEIAHNITLNNLGVLRDNLRFSQPTQKTKQLMGYYFNSDFITSNDWGALTAFSISLADVYETLLEGMSSINWRTGYISITYPGATAFVAGKKLPITLTQDWWASDHSKIPTRDGFIVHEASHIYLTAMDIKRAFCVGYKDNACYYEENAAYLARDDVWAAMANADNIRLFYEYSLH